MKGLNTIWIIILGSFVMYGVILLVEGSLHYLKTCDGPNVVQKLIIKLSGHTASQKKTLRDGAAPTQHYYFWCDTHGIVENYPRGFRELLVCSECEKEPQ